MKRLIIATSIVLGLACAGSVSAAQYETYTTNLHYGYNLMVFVGHTPAGFIQAQHAANRWEGQRHLGLGPQTVAAVAVDNSSGLVKQVRWVGPDKAVAVIDIH
ncbi:hypothetical protein IMW82_15330 [Rhodanobacter sp. B2A1Ga4]|uniref:hypothetical protein n=1 Tax=Rhodanobacter TaxID=75309 RepID=UPI000D371D8D|nr:MULTISPECIES: hypothetical protein [Rhodanobacter]MBQ4856041.1 hypothetical protein [Rhodanobacter sp. B2A1Ga4]